jgi:hypothetical protein
MPVLSSILPLGSDYALSSLVTKLLLYLPPIRDRIKW